MKARLSESEFQGWIRYINQKPADIAEIQIARLTSMVANILGGKTQTKDFLLSGKQDTKNNIYAQYGYQAPNADDMDNYLKSW